MDQIRDTSGAELYRLAKLYDAPDFVKTASSFELRGDLDMDSAHFADLVGKTFPVHSKAACWASYAFFLENAQNLSTKAAAAVEQRIVAAGRRHGISATLERLKEARAKSLEDDALCDDDFALVFSGEGGAKERHMPMRNSVETKRAAQYLYEHRDKLDYQVRRDVADKILIKAAKYGVGMEAELADYVEKQAGYGACTTAAAVELIRTRVEASRRGPGPLTPLQTEMLKLADVLEQKPAQLRQSGLRVKLAGVVDAFDRDNRLRRQIVEGRLPRLEDVLFGLTGTKMAQAQKEHTHTVTNNIYALTDIERLKLASVRELLGNEIASALTADGLHVSGEKAAQIVPTLPRGDAELFDNLMRRVGLAPVAKQSSACPVLLDGDYLKEAAAAYRPGR